MASKRTIITLPQEDKEWLEGYSKAHKVSVAKAIRKGIEKLKETDGLQTYRALVEKTRGVWKRGDGLRYQVNMRSEWNRK